MADVTDASFRRVIAEQGGPDIMWTEFVSADGLALAPEEGRRKLMLDLIYTDIERPIVAQFFTSRPENMEKAARLAQELGFDGIDINMGCPDKSIEKQGSGAAHIKNPTLAREVIRAAKRGAGNLPVSVKTRAGYNVDELDTWLPEILKEDPVAVTIHARTRKEMSKIPARWEIIKRAVEIRDRLGSKSLILGNGDLRDTDDAKEKVRETGADGAMLGRAIFGNPWLFSNRKPSIEERLNVMLRHTELFEELLGKDKNFALMKKHYKSYLLPAEGTAELRKELMNTNSAEEVKLLVGDFISKL
jgi:nifR3 family TIM-barrel protein